MSVTVNMKDLLEAGVHYGHQCRRWNPKMSKYIFGSRNGIHIIDLQQTVTAFKKACDFLESVTATGGHVLFVGTKRQSQEILATEALRSKQFFVNHRWLGGTLTNFQTVKASIHLLKKYEKASVDGTISKLTKKEALNLSRERDKLDRNLGGIKDMPGRPRAVFIADAHKERIAIEEARRLGQNDANFYNTTVYLIHDMLCEDQDDIYSYCGVDAMDIMYPARHKDFWKIVETLQPEKQQA